MYLSLEMETGVMDGWCKMKRDAEKMIEYFKDLFPASRWIIVKNTKRQSYYSGIPDSLYFSRDGMEKMIKRYGPPIKLY